MIKTEVMEPKPLDKEIRKNGYTYQLEKEGVRSFIFRQMDGTRIVGYETFKRRVLPATNKTIGNREINLGARIAFPGNEAFGVWAWSFKTLERATDKFNDLEK